MTRAHGTDAIHANVLDTIGHTPLVQLQRVARGVRPQILAKLEFLNPGGGIHDRIGLAMIEAAEQEGTLKPGGTIIERTSGSTGLGLALAAAVKGYKAIAVVPDKTSDEKIRQLRAFGVRVVITPSTVDPDDPRSYYAVARQLEEEIPDAVLVNQQVNPANPEAHYATTGPEIWQQTGGKVRAVVATIGSGGTLSGVGRYLKEQDPSIQIIAVDPVGSVLYNYIRNGELGPSSSYQVEGGSEEFVPDVLDLDVIDDVIQVSDAEAFILTRRLVREEGLFCGGSSGLALAGALAWLQRGGGASLTEEDLVVVPFPDSGGRYLSRIFDDVWMRENGYLPRNTVADLLANHQPVIAIDDNTTVEGAIVQMKTYGISQLPVLNAEGAVRGIIGEGDLLEYLLAGGTPKHTVVDVTAHNVPTVDPEMTIDALGKLFGRASAAIVLEEGKIVGIVTKIDVIDFLANQGNV